jgi:mono/diheme cytochrome c family protein
MRMTALKTGVLVLSLAAAPALFAQDQDAGAATTYKSKCAGCHGQSGEGKMGPKLQGTSLSEADIVTVLTKGKEGKKAPHGKAVSGLSEEQAKAVASYVKSLK